MHMLTHAPTHTSPDAKPSAAFQSRKARSTGRRLLITGLLLIASSGLLAALAMQFRAGGSTSAGRMTIAASGVVAGLVYFAGLWPIQFHALGTRSIAWIWCIGLAMRAIVLPTPAFLEDDFNRYLWDGAVVAHGMNPYGFAPAEVFPAYGGTAQAALPGGLLRPEADAVRTKINHPHLTTVYGPVAQAAFAVAHTLSPWSMGAWRGVLFVFDALTMVSVLALLRALKKPAALAVWYWWNPILLREVTSSGHMDVIALPLVVAALLWAVRGASVRSSAALALAVGVKVWPVVLVPLIARAAGARPKPTLVAMIVFVTFSALLWAPAALAWQADSSGFQAYALRWYNNDAVFAGTAWSIQHMLPLVGFDPIHGPRIARFLVAGALLAVMAVQTRRMTGSLGDLLDRSLFVLAIMFFLIPAQFPWYCLWMLPLLAVAPRAPLLAYAALLPLYYTHYELPWIVWIEHVPVLGWFIWDSLSYRRAASRTTAAVRELKLA